MVGNNLTNAFNAQVDIILGGYFLGANAIGLYSVPNDITSRLNNLVNPIVTQVALPVMAKFQNEELRLQRFFLQAMRMTASINAPIFIFIAFYSHEIVYLLLGEKWAPSILLLQLSAVIGLLRSLGNPIGSLLMAKGRADVSFKWNLFWVVVAVPAIFAGSYFGTIGMATMLLILGIIGYVPGWYFLVKPLCGASFANFFSQHTTPILLSVVSGALAIYISRFCAGAVLGLMVGMVGFGIVFSVLNWKFNRQWVESMLELLHLKSY